MDKTKSVGIENINHGDAGQKREAYRKTKDLMEAQNCLLSRL
jgi:hypothetical protein